MHPPRQSRKRKDLTDMSEAQAAKALLTRAAATATDQTTDYWPRTSQHAKKKKAVTASATAATSRAERNTTEEGGEDDDEDGEDAGDLWLSSPYFRMQR